MIRSLYSGVTGMKSHQTRMDVVSNNIANVNNVGYKSSSLSFKDMLYQMQLYPTAVAQGTAGAINPAQVGTGVGVASIVTDMEQGALQNTGRTLDLAIQGTGFFQVMDKNNNLFYTRTGTFYLDAYGYVVDSNGNFLTDNAGSNIQIIGGNGQVGTINISEDGTITAFDTNGTDMGVTAQIGLYYFFNQEGLTKVADNLFKETTASGGNTVSGTAQLIENVGTGTTINSGYLEMSNVDLTEEFANMITTQRGYQANGRIITTSDQMLQELLDIKR